MTKRAKIVAKLQQIQVGIYNAVLSVPVRIKITGIIVLTVLILGFSLSYWVTTSLSDWLSYLLTDVRVEAAMRAGGRSVILVTILAAAGSFVLASLLTFILIRPLLDLRDMALKVAEGQLDTRATVWSKDEIGEVAIAINKMTDHLVTTQDHLEKTNRYLRAINQVMLAAERENEVHDVLYAILESVIEVMNLEMGWVYLRDPERDLFHLASWHKIPLELQSHLMHEQLGADCDCQKALINGTLGEQTQVFPCSRLLCCTHLHLPDCHITIPIEARDEKLGIINLLCAQSYALNEEDLDLLAAIGSQVSEIVANAWLRMKLAEKEEARQALLESLVVAQEDERGRLARELHDGAGQMLTNLLVRIKALEKRTESSDMQQGLETLLDITSETIDQVRDLSYRLRPAALEEFGLSVALQILVDDMVDGLPIEAACNFDLEETALPASIEVTLYRIAQEGLTNILRHANASHIDVELVWENHGVKMCIEDDGCGFAPHYLAATPGVRHLGLISMRERAAMVGGSLELFSAPGKGTTLLVHVPVFEAVDQ